LLVDDRSRVVVLDGAAVALHPSRVRLGHVHFSLRDLRRGVGLRRTAEASLVVQASLLAERLICRVAAALGSPLRLSRVAAGAPLG
jgi:hypothetical protein